MVTAASLKTCSLKDLAEMAKSRGIRGWHGMKKEELVRALLAEARRKAAAKASKRPTKEIAAKPPVARAKAPAKPSPALATMSRRPAPAPAAKLEARKGATKPARAPKPPSPETVRQIQEAHSEREKRRDLSNLAHEQALVRRGEKIRDRIVLMVRDAFWLHAHWEVMRTSVDRAKAALAEHWHTARPCLRLIEVESGHTTSTAEKVVRLIPVHGGVRNWYIDVPQPPKSYRLDIGYLAANERFHVLAKSNVVSMPSAGACDVVDENWADVAENCDRIFALSSNPNGEAATGELQEMMEEKLHRPVGAPSSTRFGLGAERILGRRRDFKFEVDAEMIVFGSTKPGSYVTLGGEPVKLRDDGSFTVRLSLPDRRQVLPLTASSSDGTEQRTTVLSVERNTKVMEPMIREQNNQ